MSIVQTLKKVGVSATVAAVIAAVITVTPFLFKIDERYAKATELEEAIQKTDEKLVALTAEVGKLAGVTEVLVTVIGQQRAALAASNQHTEEYIYAPPPRMASAPPPAPVVAPAPPAPYEHDDGTPIRDSEINPDLYIPGGIDEPVAMSPEPEVEKEDIASASPAPAELAAENVDEVLARATESLQESQRVIERIQEE